MCVCFDLCEVAPPAPCSPPSLNLTKLVSNVCAALWRKTLICAAVILEILIKMFPGVIGGHRHYLKSENSTNKSFACINVAQTLHTNFGGIWSGRLRSGQALMSEAERLFRAGRCGMHSHTSARRVGERKNLLLVLQDVFYPPQPLTFVGQVVTMSGGERAAEARQHHSSHMSNS